MSYNIAAASSDEIHIDLSFREADSFTIIQVNDDGSYSILEKRKVQQGQEEKADVELECGSNCESGCASSGCKNGGNNGGCGNGHSDTDIEARVNIISDCRCLICRKIGPGAERQLEKKAITSFQIDLSLEEALTKITEYYTKIDNHISLRKSR